MVSAVEAPEPAAVEEAAGPPTRRLQGWVELGSGLLGLVLLGGYTAPHLGADGLTWRTGLGVLAGVAALGLTVHGTVLLLRPVRRWRRLVAVPVGLLLLAFLVAPAALGTYAGTVPRPEPGRTPDAVGLGAQDVRFDTADGTTLAAWWVPPGNGAAVVLLHGSGSTRANTLDHAALLARHGYGVLALDAQGYGDSEGRTMAFGWGAEEDVRAALDWLLAQPGVDRVGLLGLSMGGEGALTAAAADQRVAAVVAEGASKRTLADERAVQPDLGNAIMLPFNAVMFAVADLWSPLRPPAPLDDVMRSIAPRPVLLISGEEIAEVEADRVWVQAGGETVTWWQLPDTPHTKALATHPDEYEQRVVGFLDDALLGGRRS